jgi:hypothetical protein
MNKLAQPSDLKFSPIDFGAVIGELSEIGRWLRVEGVVADGRIDAYKKNIIEMLEQHINIDEDAPRVFSEMETKGRLTEILSSYVEGVEFVDTFSALRKSGARISRDLLQKVVSGPPDAYREDHKSNHGRNFMFELVVAAIVARAGYTPLLGGDSDVSFEFERRRILIECKRVMSVNKVEERIRAAARQLKKTVTGSQDCGLIAISISRTINTGDRIWSLSSTSEINAFLESEISTCIKRFDPFLQTVPPSSISGIIFYMSSPIHVQGVGFTPAKRGMMYEVSGTSDGDLLKSLAHFLQA